MTVTVVYPSADGYVDSSSTIYANAQAGSALVANTSNAYTFCGQEFASPTYYCDECFYGFDTSGIPDTDVISAAVFSLYNQIDNSDTDFTLLVAAFDYGAGIATTDWRNAAALAALTPVASFATSGWSAVAYNDFTEISGLLSAAIDKTGTTKLVVWSDRQEAGTAPTGEEYIRPFASEQTGTANDPKLTITHAALATGAAFPYTGGGFYPS